MHKTSNADVAKLLRSVAAALTLNKTSFFQVRAYENAADAIEHSTAEVKDLWEEDKLDLIPGVGANLSAYLSEYFKTGKVEHFETVMKDYHPVLFDLLEIPGIGPKTAFELTNLGIKSIEDLRSEIKTGELVKKGFSAKIAERIMAGIEEVSNRGDKRMLLPYAQTSADKVIEYLMKGPGVVACDTLGSLRRQVATIGDLDFAASSKEPEMVVEYFTKFPGVVHVSDKGENKATVTLSSGVHLDLLVGTPENYGALLQHFTGSKHHNIHLRTLAEKKGFSLSEYGVKNIKTGEVVHCHQESDLYKMLGMETPPPELREDTGEIETALKHKLPDLVSLEDIKGELHTHSNFPLEPSHGPGADTIEQIIEKAITLGYGFIGISDHPPGFTTHSKEEIVKIIKKRTEHFNSIKQHFLNKKDIRVLNGLEIDILGDGSLSVPDEALKELDYCVAGVHSGHRGGKDEITGRILKALESPYVDIISHPTNRLLNERNSSDADWETIFKFCAKNNKLLEINGYPNRLDLRDDLVKMAISLGVKFVIDTDAHAVQHMNNMRFGVSVARRGWAQKSDILNTWDWNKISDWFKID